MSWTVKWDPPIYIKLTHLWILAPDPPAVREGRDAVDRVLGTDPHAAGEHLSEGLWRAEVPPLVVYYEIDAHARLVKITNVATLP